MVCPEACGPSSCRSGVGPGPESGPASGESRSFWREAAPHGKGSATNSSREDSKFTGELKASPGGILGRQKVECMQVVSEKVKEMVIICKQTGTSMESTGARFPLLRPLPPLKLVSLLVQSVSLSQASAVSSPSLESQAGSRRCRPREPREPESTPQSGLLIGGSQIGEGASAASGSWRPSATAADGTPALLFKGFSSGLVQRSLVPTFT